MGLTDVLDLDFDLIAHLAQPNSVHYLRAEHVSDELIVDPLARQIFEWQIKHVKEHGQPATAVVLEEEFDLQSISDPQTAIGDLVNRLRQRYIRNQSRESLGYIGDIALSNPLAVGREMIKEGKRLVEVTQQRGEVFGSGDYQRVIDHYQKQANLGKGPSLGFQELDDHFNGQVGVNFLIAAPKTYKSWFAIRVMMSNILQGFFPYLYSLELPAIETDMRLRCMMADVPYWKYLKRVLSPTDQERIRIASANLDQLGSYRIEKPSQGERGVQRLIEHAIGAGANCILIDQLQYVENRKGQTLGAMNNTGDYFEVVNDLRNYSDEIPIFVVHQFNRSVMNSDGMPEMQQIKASASIEEVAALALGLWASKDMRKSGIIELGTLVSRHYPYAEWELGIELSRGCRIEMHGPANTEE